MNDNISKSNINITEEIENRVGKSLLEKNASILHMLPSLLQDLFYKDYNSNAIMRYFESIEAIDGDDKDETFLQLKLQVQALVHGKKIENDKLEAVTIDQNKTVLLSLLMGSCYHEALEILSNKDNINIEILCRQESEAQRLGEYYLSHLQLPDECNDEAVFIIITQKCPNDNKKQLNKKNITTARKKLQYLEIKALLEKMGFSLNNNGAIVPFKEDIDPLETSNECEILREKIQTKLNVSLEKNFVDLNNWYCSCERYQKCYLPNDDNRPQLSLSSISTIAFPKTITVDELTAGLSEAFSTSLMSKLLHKCTTQMLDPIPMCPHILAMLILLYNKDINPSYYISCLHMDV